MAAQKKNSEKKFAIAFEIIYKVRKKRLTVNAFEVDASNSAGFLTGEAFLVSFSSDEPDAAGAAILFNTWDLFLKEISKSEWERERKKWATANITTYC